MGDDLFAEEDRAMSMFTSPERKKAIEFIYEERARQDKKFGIQNHDMMTWYAIIGEEFGELGEAMLHHKFGGPKEFNVMEEAVHTCASVLAFMEAIIRNQGVGEDS